MIYNSKVLKVQDRIVMFAILVGSIITLVVGSNILWAY
jgi:hypothetical protein